MTRRFAGCTLALVALLAVSAWADTILNENFNAATGQGGGIFLVGAGTSGVNGWDTGLAGEAAFGGTAGNARVAALAAYATLTGGVGGTAAGVIDMTGLNFNLLDESFNTASGLGGGTFLAGDGTPNTSGYTLNWDDGLAGEGAFAGTFNGAAILAGGGAAALGLPAGGLSGTGGGRISMNKVSVGAGGWYAGLQWTLGALPGAAPFYNPGFESGFANWQPWGNAYVVIGATVPVTPHGGNNVLKMFGNFTGGYNTTGVFQTVAAKPGQLWSLSAFVQHVPSDAITGTQNHVDAAIEFYNAAGQQLDTVVQTVLSGSSPTGIWIATTPLQRTAPAGTASARAVFLFVQPGVGTYEPGAGLVDDVSFRVVGGPPSVDLTQHALTVSLQGVANGAAGEVLGDVQLRLEDTQGNRLFFRTQANGAWQTLGGPLSTATEADANGVPATGVFDVNSPQFVAVVAFDDSSTHRWGTGGTLNVDNLRLTNSDAAGSAWYAGLDWPHLAIPNPDLNALRLTADVLGSVPGGKYELRVEAMRDVSAGLDENFNTVTGVGGGFILSAADVSGGTTYRFIDTWDTGIAGEGAYAGVYGQAEIFPGGGMAARGLTTGGLNGTGGGELRVENVIVGPGGGWYAGLNWPNQALASTDLSQVVLRADIKGTTASGGELGPYELRIEDADGDRMYFPRTATGGWQSVGGPLSTATFGTSLGGVSNGIFDLDSPSYAVVVSFRDEAATWLYGGVLTVDNLFLTPVITQRELGRITFNGTATGAWQTIGGPLASGTSSFRNLDERFNGVTGTGGGEYWQAGGMQNFGALPWDDGLTGEEVFGGIWGSGALGTVNAWGCTSCGVGGSGAGNVSVTGAAGGGSGGWWAGLSWQVPPPDWSTLSQVFLTAQVKSSKLAPFQLRVEDGSSPPANPVWLAFTHTPTTTGFEAVGGPISQAVHGCPNPPCAAFNFNAPYYKVTLVYSGSTWDTAWGTGGQLTIDNLYFTGIGFADADSYTVTVTFQDEIATWGPNARLTVDNLRLATGPTLCPGDVNCSGAVDFDDIDRFVEALSYPGGAGWPYPNCPWLNGDCNGDGNVNFDDIDPFVARIGASCP